LNIFDQLLPTAEFRRVEAGEFHGPEALDECVEFVMVGSHHVVYHA
jgi:hypothetical protein